MTVERADQEVEPVVAVPLPPARRARVEARHLVAWQLLFADVLDPDIRALDAERAPALLLLEPAGLAHEGLALPDLVPARCLTDQDVARVERADTTHHPRLARMEACHRPALLTATTTHQSTYLWWCCSVLVVVLVVVLGLPLRGSLGLPRRGRLVVFPLVVLRLPRRLRLRLVLVVLRLRAPGGRLIVGLVRRHAPCGPGAPSRRRLALLAPVATASPLGCLQQLAHADEILVVLAEILAVHPVAPDAVVVALLGDVDADLLALRGVHPFLVIAVAGCHAGALEQPHQLLRAQALLPGRLVPALRVVLGADLEPVRERRARVLLRLDHTQVGPVLLHPRGAGVLAGDGALDLFDAALVATSRHCADVLVGPSKETLGHTVQLSFPTSYSLARPDASARLLVFPALLRQQIGDRLCDQLRDADGVGHRVELQLPIGALRHAGRELHDHAAVRLGGRIPLRTPLHPITSFLSTSSVSLPSSSSAVNPRRAGACPSCAR